MIDTVTFYKVISIVDRFQRLSPEGIAKRQEIFDSYGFSSSKHREVLSLAVERMEKFERDYPNKLLSDDIANDRFFGAYDIVRPACREILSGRIGELPVEQIDSITETKDDHEFIDGLKDVFADTAAERLRLANRTNEIMTDIQYSLNVTPDPVQ